MHGTNRTIRNVPAPIINVTVQYRIPADVRRAHICACVEFGQWDQVLTCTSFQDAMSRECHDVKQQKITHIFSRRRPSAVYNHEWIVNNVNSVNGCILILLGRQHHSNMA